MSPSCQSHGQSPSLRHIWTSRERKALLILKDEYELSWDTLTPVFNCWLDADQGVRQRVLYAQYSYFSRPATSSKQRDAQTAFSSAYQDLDTLCQELQQVGLKLGIEIHKPYPGYNIENTQTYDKSLKRKTLSGTLHPESEMPNMLAASPSKKQHSFPDIVRSTYPSTPSQVRDPQTPPSVNSHHTGPRSPPPQPSSPTLAIKTVRRNLPNAVHSLGLPTCAPQISPSSLPELPLVGFRGYSDKSQGLNSPQGFRAGAFVGAANIPQCPAVTDASFIAEATFHVGWTKDHSSPFISITTSCIRAIMKSRSPKSGRYLAILDLRKIRSSGSIFEAKSLNLRPTKPNGDLIKYHSGGEHLIWVCSSSTVLSSDIPNANAMTCRGQSTRMRLFRVSQLAR